ncbi:Fc.00g083060.m01.CDS01 [Cosmosporella sp. VM-42]
MSGTGIALLVKHCLALNKGLIQALENGDDELSSSLSLRLSDQNSRFIIWSANVGAHRTGTSSLEYRLRDASHIKETVRDLLDDLQHLIEDATNILTGEVTPWDQLPEDEFLEEDCGSDDVPATELEQITMDVKEVVDSLLRLSMTIRNPAPHDRFIASLSTETSHFVIFDIDHVKSKHGMIEPWLAERLGESNSRRRQYFKYRQAHHDKLAYGLGEDDDKAAPSTLASSIPEKLKDAGVELARGDDNSDSGWLSQTSFATSTGQAERLRVPKMPRAAQEGPFECPFCYMILQVSDRRGWKKHVYGDLRPYVCLERDCVNPEQEFTRRHEWIDHMKQNHWTFYRCPALGCGKSFRSAAACRGHAEQCHSGQMKEDQLDALITLNSESENLSMGFKCPLCNENQRSVVWYQRHVGRHQEQLSLFALPSVAIDEDEIGDRDSYTYDISNHEHGSARDKQIDDSPSDSEEIDTREWGLEGEQLQEVPQITEDERADSILQGTNLTDMQAERSSEEKLIREAVEPLPVFREVKQSERKEEYTRRLLEDLRRSGLDEEVIAAILKKEDLKQQNFTKPGQGEDRSAVPFSYMGSSDVEHLDAKTTAATFERRKLSAPGLESDRINQVYTRMSRRHLSIETLNNFNIPFEDDADPDYVLIKRWVPEWEQDQLWANTKRIRESRSKGLEIDGRRHHDYKIEDG